MPIKNFGNKKVINIKDVSLVKKANEIHVVYASDNNFADVMGISIISLYENNVNMDQIHLYILESEISEDNKQKVENIAANYGRVRPLWIKTPDINSVMGLEVKLDRGSSSQFSRLFISSVLPESVKKVLYLDCDIIINRPLDSLWNIDLENKTAAALLDSFGSLYRKNLGLQKNDILINSGVMLIDLDKWKEKEIEKKLLAFIKRYDGLIPQGDQGALGAILSNEIQIMDPKYNVITLFYDFNYKEMLVYRKPPYYYSEEKIINALREPYLIHFTSSFASRRPWIEGSTHPEKEKWDKYKKLSPWYNETVKSYNSSKIKALYLKLFNNLPRYFSIRLSGIIQAYGRPIYEKIKYRI